MRGCLDARLCCCATPETTRTCASRPGYNPAVRRALATGVAACVWGVALLMPRDASPHYPVTTTVLFNREIATLFQRACLPCHAAGGLAMSLATFEEARPWAVAIKEEILERRMPPWPAERGYGEFANDLSLTTRERDFLVSWVDGGTPKGEVEPPAYVDHGAHWMLGTPDAVLTAGTGVRVEPGRPVQRARLIMQTAVPRQTWLRALDYKPSDKRVVRAAVFSLVETGQYLGTWTPWRTTVQMPDGAGVRVPARARIAIDVVYQSAPEPVVDSPSLGLYFSKALSNTRSNMPANARPAREVTTTTIEGVMPSASTAAASGIRLMARYVVPRDRSIFDVRPDVGPGGRSIEVKVTRPDGSSQVLLWIKTFRQDWQTSYVLPRPLTLPKGSVVSAVAYFDPAPSQALPRFTLTFNSIDAGLPPGPAGPPVPAGPTALSAGFGPRLPGSARER